MKKTIILITLLICISCNCEQREAGCTITKCNNDTIEKSVGVREYRELQRKRQNRIDSIKIVEELNKQSKKYCLGNTDRGI